MICNKCGRLKLHCEDEIIKTMPGYPFSIDITGHKCREAKFVLRGKDE